VRQEIEERLAVMAAAWQEEPEAVSAQAPVTDPDGNPAAQAYRRLLTAGWIEEERDCRVLHW